ncbi:MAG TPA: PD-(D/E)XK nuclease family protein, partial [Blastocatellia bacterium]|nr:PD-(D/E)XK nuclease family protein [Blastocatellia bacterium]
MSCSASTRLKVAADWIEAHPLDAEVLLVASSAEAGDDLVRAVTSASDARFGLARTTLDRAAVRLAAPLLAGSGRTPASRFSLVAIAARATHLLYTSGKLSYFTPVARRPGLPEAITRSIEELRMNEVSPDLVRQLPRSGADLAAFAECIDRELREARLADRAAVFESAIEAVNARQPPPVGARLLLLDLKVTTRREAEFLTALLRHAPASLATSPLGDERSIGWLKKVLNSDAEVLEPEVDNSLARLKRHLFEDTSPPPGKMDSSVSLESWPGEARECVEIARAVQSQAARGMAFDRMAVFLRSPTEYRPHLEEAFRRAAIPAYLARGTTRPDPAGRALLALLACAAEKFSARRFAEYVSLSQVPDHPAEPEEIWAPPKHDLIPAPEAAAVEPAEPDTAGGQYVLPFDQTSTASERDAASLTANPDAARSIDGALRAPWRWERLLVEAAVIGGRDRWARRLSGLEEEFRLKRKEITDEEEARVALLDRDLRDIGHLRDFALPLIDRLAALPDSATWGEWLTSLRDLAATSLRDPDNVVPTLAELEPASLVGPIDLDEVRLVLEPRLRELSVPPPRRRYGAVFVGTAEAARGLSFELVFVPGLAEKLFPRKVTEDPVLPDSQREQLGHGVLVMQRDRVDAERMALRLAVGAASSRVLLSYPRVDMEQARPRVPSFYSLEAVRAIEGILPGFDSLAKSAEKGATGRLGWPAPDRPADAIDEAEYDLALLSPLLHVDEEANAGTATYLLSANPHLARAMRARARRWIRRWTPADGLVDPDDAAREALRPHQIPARSFSPTALQNFSICPYRFFLQAIHRLEPREDPVALEIIDPLTRGSLFHDCQFEILSRMKAEALLPLQPANLDRARQIVEEAVTAEARRYEDKLAPAIPRVWEDGINSIRADLREWLRRMADEPDGWVPDRFELSFGIIDRDRAHADPASVPHSIEITRGLHLRGSIDLVEKRTGVLRATDHKTGKARAKPGVIFGGGAVLQPVLYGLACEKMLGDQVQEGRLYYCTLDGGFEERLVPLDNYAREGAGQVVEAIDGALKEGFFPAYPDKGACRWCDYLPVCGPFEEARTRRKPKDRL